MPIELSIHAGRLNAATAKKARVFLRWLHGEHPLRRRYVMEIWPPLYGITLEKAALVMLAYAEDVKAEKRAKRTEERRAFCMDSLWVTMAHEYRHLMQRDGSGPENDRGVENWASARVREAMREGVI